MDGKGRLDWELLMQWGEVDGWDTKDWKEVHDIFIENAGATNDDEVNIGFEDVCSRGW